MRQKNSKFCFYSFNQKPIYHQFQTRLPLETSPSGEGV